MGLKGAAVLDEPQRRKDHRERASRATEDRSELWEPSTGALEVATVESSITYKRPPATPELDL